jgi:ELWxxDGT repeat protein
MKNLFNTRLILPLTSLLSLLSLFTAPVLAGAPYRLGDLNTAPGSPLFTVPVPLAGFLSLGNRALFSTADPETGDEGILWSTDGTAPGTVALSSSLCPSPCYGIRPLAVWHGLALLQVFPGSAPPYLLRSDGTPEGTFPLTGPLGTLQSVEIQAPPSGSFFFFDNCPDRLQCGLWRSDGTPAGTGVLKGGGDLSLASAHSFAVRGDRLFFLAGPGVSDFGLWSTDGTPEGTVLLGEASGYPVVATPSHVFFASGETGQDLWVTEGTPGSARLLAHFPPGSCSPFPDSVCDTPAVDSMAAFGDAVYFFAHRPGHNAEIWRSDGTRPGTRPLIELPAAASPVLNLQRIGGHWLFLSALPGQPETFWTVDDGFTRAAPLTGCDRGCPEFAGPLTAPGPATWLFIGKDPFHGEEAWITDGTGPGTRRLVDACPGECSGIRPVKDLGEAFPGPSGKTYFRVYPREDAYYEAAGDELWVTDGTPAGTRRVAGHFSEVGFAGSLALFGSLRPENPAYELWSTDGARTRKVAVLRRFAQGSDPSFVPFQDGVLLLADTGVGDRPLWRSDGTPDGTLLVRGFARGKTQTFASFLPSPKPSFQLLEVDHQKGSGGPIQTEVWRTDGTPDGTLRLADLGADTFFGLSTLWDGKLLFDVEGSDTGCSFWTSDGTAAGTRQILPSRPDLRCPTALADLGSRFLFVARVGTGDHPIPQIFLSDGTPAGTRQISAIQESREPLDDQPVRIGDTVFLRLANPVSLSPDLWQTDGTPAGTHPAFPQAEVNDLTAFRGDLYFTARLPLETGGRGLFRVVLPGGSPVLLARVNDSSGAYYLAPPAQLTPIGDRLLFVGQDPEHGVELWVTDGTAEGTRRLRDLQPGPGSSNPDGLTALGSRVFFTADGGTNGRELWESDGTPRGTRRLTDIAPGGFSAFPFNGYDFSAPPSFTLANGLLFIGADDGATGIEPWVLPLD